MAKFFLNSLLLLRRASTIAAESTKTQTVTSSVNKKVADSVRKEVFWMRDPKTGNWIPETHFEQIDVAELREKLLSKKTKL
ncbi:protein SENESCENCE-ASSOCIATED GENE 21, mitochondrial-like isoform X2 [Olea europaea var. sylvestris]|uniref:SENESCENCE-ASSOCIATED GENE 21, mitochondrial-like n=1 Tax=Olea europaea subsp. europaea TaxID=158383 RepID=A0A8S0TX76_OLEEU|nr:protein SENESCENCE-ASSOCIATED GENE 21, mitochondrial-like isoform X2 [Olea europaea var. sylvestris]CAA3008673.1 SENESCENCE-ASSOCIATED GENE 21, mitochondrial-like [Olea europaea subsp. europaea]